MKQAQNLIPKIYRSESTDPWFNLAAEERLLRDANEGEITLYLWQNQTTVVIGRNQNPWKECDCSRLESDGGKLARRPSGGGAVFHDLGNLNFTFITDKHHYDFKRQVEIIARAIRKLGIPVEFSGRNDLMVAGKKISGNAYYHGENAVLHHGCILINTDFEKMLRYLRVSGDKIAAKGISSVRSRVGNLVDSSPGLTPRDLAELIQQSFQEIHGAAERVIPIQPPAPILDPFYTKYASWEWRYGKTPEFDVALRKRFSWGEIDLRLKLKNAHIAAAHIYSDAMNSRLIGDIAEIIKDRPYNGDALSSAIRQLEIEPVEPIMIEDVSDWLLAEAP